MHLLTNYRGQYPMIDSGIGSSNGVRGWPRCACGRRMHTKNKFGVCMVCYKRLPAYLAYRAEIRRRYVAKRPPIVPFEKCRGCSGDLSRKSRYGVCRRCFKTNPEKRAEWRDQANAERKLKFAADPARKERWKANRREINRVTRSSPEGRMHFLVYCANARARKRGEPYGVTLEDLLPLPTVCPALGIPLTYNGTGHNSRINSAASLDRVVPEKGYVRGNVCVVSWRANGIKRDAAPKELMDIALYAGRMAGLR